MSDKSTALEKLRAAVAKINPAPKPTIRFQEYDEFGNDADQVIADRKQRERRHELAAASARPTQLELMDLDGRYAEERREVLAAFAREDDARRMAGLDAIPRIYPAQNRPAGWGVASVSTRTVDAQDVAAFYAAGAAHARRSGDLDANGNVRRDTGKPTAIALSVGEAFGYGGAASKPDVEVLEVPFGGTDETVRTSQIQRWTPTAQPIQTATRPSPEDIFREAADDAR